MEASSVTNNILQVALSSIKEITDVKQEKIQNKKRYICLTSTQLYLTLMIIFFTVSSVFTLIMQYSFSFVITESISIILLLIVLNLILFNETISSWKHVDVLMGWFFFILFYVNTFVSINVQMNRPLDPKSQLFLHNKYFYNVILGNFSFFYCFKPKNSKWHYVFMNIFNSIMIISLYFWMNFIYETCSVWFFSIFITTRAWRNTNTSVYFNHDIKETGHSEKSTTESRLFENGFFGSCIVNESFEIISKNEYFSINMDHLVTKSPANIDLKDSRVNLKGTLESFQNMKSTVLGLLNKTQTYELCETKTLFLNAESIYQRVENSLKESTVIYGQNFRNKITLKETLQKQIEKNKSENNSQNTFYKLGKFKCYAAGIAKYYDVIYVKCEEKDNVSSKDLYKLFFIELSHFSKQEQLKIEKKYKNLLLGKISHEFKAPIMIIQNTIEGIMTGNNTPICQSPVLKNFEKSFKSMAYLHHMSIDPLIKIKYLAEIILLMVLDINEYITLRSDNTDNLIKNSNQSMMELTNLKEYLQQLSKVYCEIFNKNLQIQIYLDELLENAKLVIDEKKLKQILSNLISNAIKNSVEGNSLKIHIVRKNFEFTPQGRLNEEFSLIEPPKDPLEEKPLHSCYIRGHRQLSTQKLSLPKSSRLGYGSPSKPHPNNEVGLLIILEDSGKGINEKLLNAINTKKTLSFLKEDRSTSNLKIFHHEAEDYAIKKGLGTGLSICKKLCEDLGIEMKCELIHEEPIKISQASELLFIPKNNSIIFTEHTIGTKFILTVNNDIEYYDSMNATKLAFDKDLQINPADKICISYEDDNVFEHSDKLIHEEADQYSDKNIRTPHKCCCKIQENLEINHSQLQIIGMKKILRRKNNSCETTIGEDQLSMKFHASIPSLNFQINKPNQNMNKKDLNKSPKRSCIKSRTVESMEKEDAEKYENNTDIHVGLTSGTELLNFTRPIDSVISEKDDSDRSPINQSQNCHTSDIQPRESPVSNISNIPSSKICPAEASLSPSKYSRNNVQLSNYPFSPHRRNTKFTFQAKLSEEPSYNNCSTVKNFQPSSTMSPRKMRLNFDQISNNSGSENSSINQSTICRDKIVIVDDNSSNSRAIEILVKSYYRKNHISRQLVTKRLVDGIELLYEIYKEVKYGKDSTKVIFCDQMMEYMNGSQVFTLLKNIFTEKKTRPIPFVICSSFNDPGHKEFMQALGIEYVYEKPLNCGNVEYILNSLLKTELK